MTLCHIHYFELGLYELDMGAFWLTPTKYMYTKYTYVYISIDGLMCAQKCNATRYIDKMLYIYLVSIIILILIKSIYTIR